MLWIAETKTGFHTIRPGRVASLFTLYETAVSALHIHIYIYIYASENTLHRQTILNSRI